MFSLQSDAVWVDVCPIRFPASGGSGVVWVDLRNLSCVLRRLHRFQPRFRYHGSHVERLEEIFRRLRPATLKLHIKKCSLFQQRVHFLGHAFTKSGIEVQPEKVSVVQQWPVPRSLTEHS